MGGGGVVVLDTQLRAKILEGVVVKLFPIIWDQGSRDPILVDDVSLYEDSHVLLCDGGQGFSNTVVVKLKRAVAIKEIFFSELAGQHSGGEEEKWEVEALCGLH